MYGLSMTFMLSYLFSPSLPPSPIKPNYFLVHISLVLYHWSEILPLMYCHSDSGEPLLVPDRYWSFLYCCQPGLPMPTGNSKRRGSGRVVDFHRVGKAVDIVIECAVFVLWIDGDLPVVGSFSVVVVSGLTCYRF